MSKKDNLYYELPLRIIIAEARANNIEVVYVQHDDGTGTDLCGGREMIIAFR